VSDEAAKNIEREDSSLRVAEAPQLAQGLAADAAAVGFALPPLQPEVGAGEAFSLATLAHELSWQSAMAELLSLVRLEGLAAVHAAAAQSAPLPALGLLLAPSSVDQAARAVEPQAVERQAEPEGRTAAPGFVDSGFGNPGVSVLSLQNKDLFGAEDLTLAEPTLAADFDPVGRPVIDYDLFGSQDGGILTSVSKIDNPIVGTGALLPTGLEQGGSGVIGAAAGNDGPMPGFIKLAEGRNDVTLSLEGVLKSADESHSLLIRGDGDDNLKLVGDWVLVSEDPANSVSVYAHADSGATVTADHVEVILA